MKHRIIALSIMMSAFSSAAMATGDGTIHFTGEVIDTPCTISTATDSQTVNLKQSNTTVLATAGSVGENQKFSIDLEGCDTTTYTTASIAFTGTPADGDTTVLENTGTATNVGIQLTDASGKVLPIDASSSYDATLTDGDSNSIPFYARIIATADGAVAGNVDADATFTITYN